MAQRTPIDGYTLITFAHDESLMRIYLENPLALLPFQVESLENFFKRTVFYCENGTDIDLIAQKLKDGDISIIAYFYNNNQDYDYCGIFDDVFVGLHNALSDLLNISIINKYNRLSMGYDNDDYYYDDEEEENIAYEDLDEEITRAGENQDFQIPGKYSREDLTDLGRAVDKIFEDKEEDN
ncbi:MAG: hypothetical protein A3B89_03885 [Candidatus Buchananbacteria bacterium RIFCSPHIGHO2_02_FULL_40_13]|uniref:Uncharacterized protein n=1 Tax=Candidatus Buchananbacteria bacterium RIFCSPLOWO2_01_FULL_39_33 TaxID=1797543 RepID=A0A1G1YLU1_9BACT|nr:MAG: hypothetical protein A2820_02480 [Candidatus Buchananbacteria bacterium RIFCSPHIGHO2_01_FULL_40_35]OGY50701.1 MAG: hypothetical protein A3B89_03885 [Candidatus Buchananbacteria bacterium RIFCSPHIGHO2_02_FULL_40_13]OGY52630.1 MAG: hypothetical protein A3A02_03855 [Candidatus Buchananbacteria bacterium RIFCSPLOWO2_01_FULL_39_33]